jgi:hypothetical protein
LDKVIFYNANGEKIEFSANSKYALININDLGGGSVSNKTISSPFQDGSTPIGDSYFESKLMEIEFATVSTDLPEDLRRLDSIVNPKSGNGTLELYQNGRARKLSPVRVRRMPTRRNQANIMGDFLQSTIIFEVYDPYYQDAQPIEAEVTTGGNSFNFPLNITANYEFDYVNTAGVIVNNEGDIDTPVTVIFDGPKTAPLSIENLTTGESIVLSLDLLMNERLIVTTGIQDTNVIKEDLTTGETEVAFQYIDIAETTFFTLAKGENRIQIVTDEGIVQDATVKFRNKYVGV